VWSPFVAGRTFHHKKPLGVLWLPHGYSAGALPWWIGPIVAIAQATAQGLTVTLNNEQAKHFFVLNVRRSKFLDWTKELTEHYLAVARVVGHYTESLRVERYCQRSTPYSLPTQSTTTCRKHSSPSKNLICRGHLKPLQNYWEKTARPQQATRPHQKTCRQAVTSTKTLNTICSITDNILAMYYCQLPNDYYSNGWSRSTVKVQVQYNDRTPSVQLQKSHLAS